MLGMLSIMIQSLPTPSSLFISSSKLHFIRGIPKHGKLSSNAFQFYRGIPTFRSESDSLFCDSNLKAF